ncbi:hypothetical protein JCM17846_01570 [Iodidimonas nitroreducens]|uniref:1-(5-phosphoribosyl)-5-((5-phosphoribosylamino)methylideneamino)imidazole-4-carboxamide isomerase n=1 Tax=Iodidimonas nitroreducens TaxID=1236968 RepID=A0A5A7N440_9PROT|nr:hypothetical protein [Iodidimonas nitroreducens]GER02475.1 hypothetical protein JCM17846_01570 [Iodidimonas nitroreducens]
MKLYPAIDLKDGKAVRLQKGDMAKAPSFMMIPQPRRWILSKRAVNICIWWIWMVPFRADRKMRQRWKIF